MPRKVKEITPEVLQYFEYNEESPTGIVWKNTPSNKKGATGKPAGSFNHRHKYNSPSGVRVTVGGTSYLVHRIIVRLHGTELREQDVVDHIDGNPFNNKIENLRVVDLKTNLRNRGLDSRNSTGVTGVHWKLEQDRTYACCVYLDESGKRRVKYFSVKKFGLIPAFHEACCFRVEILKKLNETGGNYHKLHGKARK